jgi:hypothetical protein
MGFPRTWMQPSSIQLDSFVGFGSESFIAVRTQVLAKLAHPNIVAYYGSFVDNEDLNVVMEYADGGTLSSHIQKAKVPFTEAAIMRLFTQVRSPYVSYARGGGGAAGVEEGRQRGSWGGHGRGAETCGWLGRLWGQGGTRRADEVDGVHGAGGGTPRDGLSFHPAPSHAEGAAAGEANEWVSSGGAVSVDTLVAPRQYIGQARSHLR